MEVTFKNELGSFVMGGADFFGIRMCEITGLGFNAPNRTTETYNGLYGVKTVSRHIPSRTITVSGEINSDYVNRRKTKQDISRIISKPGVLTICSLGRHRSIDAEAVKCDFGDRNPLIQKFTLQFACDEGVFYSSEVIQKSIATIIPYIKNEFTLPMVFSEKFDKITVNNTGDLNIEPVIRLIDTGGRALEGSSDSIIIRNNTYGNIISLTYSTSENEELTVNIPERKINSNLTDKDLYCFSDDTILSEFILPRGKSEIEIINQTARNLHCEIEYRELYTECEV